MNNLPDITTPDGELELWQLKSGVWYLTVAERHGPDMVTIQLSRDAVGELIRQLLKVRLQLDG